MSIREQAANPYLLGDLSIYARWWRKEARHALLLLSGDLHYDNIAKAKKVLQKAVEILEKDWK